MHPYSDRTPQQHSLPRGAGGRPGEMAPLRAGVAEAESISLAHPAVAEMQELAAIARRT